MKDKRGPKRIVKSAVRLGDYGNTEWTIVLECDHVLKSRRKPKIAESKLCCKACLNPKSQAVAEYGVWVDYDDMTEIKLRARIAYAVGVPIDQVSLVGGTATAFLDAEQVRKFL